MTGSPNDETGGSANAGSPGDDEAQTPEAHAPEVQSPEVGLVTGHTTRDASEKAPEVEPEVEIDVAAAVRVSVSPGEQQEAPAPRHEATPGEPAGTGGSDGAGPPSGGGPSGPHPPEGEEPPSAGQGVTTPPVATAEVDIAARVGDTVDDVVTLVRDKTLVPAERVVHAAALSLVVVMLALALFTMLVIGTVRILTYYVGEENVWAAYWGAGIIFLAGGTVLWSMRQRMMR